MLSKSCEQIFALHWLAPIESQFKEEKKPHHIKMVIECKLNADKTDNLCMQWRKKNPLGCLELIKTINIISNWHRPPSIQIRLENCVQNSYQFYSSFTIVRPHTHFAIRNWEWKKYKLSQWQTNIGDKH